MAASPTKSPVVTDCCPRCTSRIEAAAGEVVCPKCALALRVFKHGQETHVFSKQAYDKLLPILAGSYSVAAEQIQPRTTLEDLGADSLDVVELTMKLEEEFGISLPTEDENSIGTVGDLIRAVDRCLEAKKG